LRGVWEKRLSKGERAPAHAILGPGRDAGALGGFRTAGGGCPTFGFLKNGQKMASASGHSRKPKVEN